MKKHQICFLVGTLVLIFTFSSFDSALGEDENYERIETALNLLKMDRLDEAIPILEDILENDPKNLDVMRNLSVAYYESDMCYDAIQLYDRILEVTPGSSEIYYGKAVCHNDLGMPEESLSSLEKIDREFWNDNSVLITKGNAYYLLQEFEESAKIYGKILEKEPEHQLATKNLLMVSAKLKDHELTRELLLKILGDEPRRLSGCGAVGCMGNMPFLVPIKDSEEYTATVQLQVRNSSNELVALVESNTINFTPHPIMEQILVEQGVKNMLEKEDGEYVSIKLEDKIEPQMNSYFVDRVEYYYNNYSILFAYNLAVPIESGDYIITEWIIERKN